MEVQMNWQVSFIRLLATVVSSALFTFVVSALLSLGHPQLALASGNAPAPMRDASRGFITQSLVSEFNTCDVLTGTISPALTDTVVSSADAGEIRLASVLEDYFDGTELDPTRWITETPVGTNQIIMGSGFITLSSQALRSVARLPVDGRMIEMRARMQAGASVPDVNLGFGRSVLPGPPSVYIGYGGGPCPDFGEDCFGANRLFITLFESADPTVKSNARDLTDTATLYQIANTTLTDFHEFQIAWGPTQTTYALDGNYIPTSTFASTNTYTPYVWLLNWGFYPVDVDWVRVLYYPTSTGKYESCAFTGMSGYSAFSWSNITWTADLPAGTSVGFETRTSTDGSTWSTWAPVAADGSTSNPTGLYFQYRATLTTTDINASPEIQQVRIQYSGPNAITIRHFAVSAVDDAPNETTIGLILSVGVSFGTVVAWTRKRRSPR
jgi:hypothetical protein